MGKARPSRIKPETLEREAEVLKLRRGGFTFDMIAQKLNFSHASGAHKAYVNACKRIVYNDVDETRKLELERLDIAQSSIWNNVIGGDTVAINTFVKIVELRAKLLGLYAPTKAQIEMTLHDPTTIDAEVARLVALLDSGKARALDA